MVRLGQRTPGVFFTKDAAMKIKRLPIIFLVVGVAVKGTEVLIWRCFQPPMIYRLAVTYDPLGFWIADRMIALMFDRW